MDLLMNGLLTAATLFAGGYCWVLARRVRDLKSLDSGLGASIVTLTRQIELARATLDEARGASRDSRHELSQLIARADAAAGQLRLLLAAVREPEPLPATAPPAPEPARAAPAPAPEARPSAPPAPAPEPTLVAVRLAPPPEPPPVAQLRQPEEPEAAPPPRPAAPHLAEVPKPRALAPVENPLRRAKGVAPAGPSRSEDEILEALSALAGGAGR
jgi:hypothetical protein